MKHGKRFRQCESVVIPGKIYDLREALALVKETATSKFDETVEWSVCLNIDARKSDQVLRGVIALPAGTGRDLKVAVFARGEKVDEAKAAGAYRVGSEDLASELLSGGKVDFQRVIATPDMMGVTGRLAKLLGPKGLMPQPKLGTVTWDIASAVAAARSGSIVYRANKNGVVQGILGKASFSVDQLEKNIRAFFAELMRVRPESVKGNYIKGISLSSTMGPGVKLNFGGLFDKRV